MIPSENSAPDAAEARAGAGGNGQLALSRRLVRNPSLKIIFCGEDEVLVLHGMRSDFKRIITDEGRTHLLGRVLRAMTTPHSLQELYERGVLDDEALPVAADLVDSLLEQGILTDPAESPAARYLETLLGRAQPLTEASVGIVGAGYLGARMAEELARTGVGRLHLLDDRRVADAAFDRVQLQMRPGLLEDEKPYAACVRDHLAELGYDRVEAHDAPYTDAEALAALFDASHFVIVASDVFASHLFHTTDLAALAAETPWMSVFVDGSEGCIGPIYVPGETCCYNEFEIQTESTLPSEPRAYYTYKEAMARPSGANGRREAHFVFPPHLSVAAGFAASAAAGFLIAHRSFLVGRCLRINFEKPYVDYEEILKLPRSPVATGTRSGYRSPFY